MKTSKKIIFCILTCLASLSVTAKVTHPHDGRIQLDQSKDILFEQFAPNTYSLQLLQAKNKFDEHGVVLGGLVEADWQHWWGDTVELTPPGIYQEGNGLYFTQATGDIMANLSRWSTAFFSLADSHIGRPGPDGNYIYVPHAFLAFGNLDQFPLYTTLGVSSIPFGIFTGSGSWDSPLTAAYFNPIQAPQISIAYYKDGLNISATDTDQNNHENNFSYSVYYNKDLETVSYSLGAGYLTDLKSNNAGNPTINQNNASTSIDLGAVLDLNAGITYNQIGLNAEYTRGHDKVEANSNKPSAFSITATYTPTIAGQDTPFGITYSRAIHLKHTPASLSGENSLQQSNAGLKTNWAMSVTRPIFTKNIYIGLDLEKTTTFFDHNTYTGTVDLTAYI